jgi:hypothetical protein
MNYFPQSPMYLLSLPVHPGFFGLLAATTGNATWRTQNLAKRYPILTRVEFFAPDACNLLDGGAHAGIAYNSGFLPVRDHLLARADSGGELDLRSGFFDRFVDARLCVSGG